MRMQEYGRKDYALYYARAHHERSAEIRRVFRWILRVLPRLLGRGGANRPQVDRLPRSVRG